MVIEWLKIQVKPELREKYIQKEVEIWNPALAKYPGFLGKEIWINPEKSNEVISIIRWETREAWKSIPEAEIQEITKKFDEAMASNDYEMIEQSEFQVRKFPHV